MKNKIYIGNLPFDIKEEDVESFFGEFGAIEDVAIIRDRETGRSKGFGFVTFANEDEAEKAIKETEGKDFHGRPIKVNMAKERTDKPRRDTRPSWRRGA